jgi:uncharacterized protein with PIN domain
MAMAKLDTFPGIDECIVCYGKVRPASPREVAARLRIASPQYRAAVEQHDGTWYICPKCGPESAVKWQSISWEDD